MFSDVKPSPTQDLQSPPDAVKPSSPLSCHLRVVNLEDGYDKVYPDIGTRQVLCFESVCAGRLRARP